MTGEEWLLILKRIMEYCEYDVILLDLGGQMEGIFELLQRCERIYMPVAATGSRGQSFHNMRSFFR